MAVQMIQSAARLMFNVKAQTHRQEFFFPPVKALDLGVIRWRTPSASSPSAKLQKGKMRVLLADPIFGFYGHKPRLQAASLCLSTFKGF